MADNGAVFVGRIRIAVAAFVLVGLLATSCGGSGDGSATPTPLGSVGLELETTTEFDIADALLTTDDLSDGWVQLGEPAAMDSDDSGFLLACAESIEADLGLVKLGLQVGHRNTTGEVTLSTSVRSQDLTAARAILERTDEVALACQRRWTVDHPDGTSTAYRMAPDQPELQLRGDSASQYAVLATESNPDPALGPTFRATVVQIRCTDVTTRVVIRRYDGTLNYELEQELADLAYTKLAATVRASGGSC